MKALPLAVKAHNANSHAGLMKSAPEDVKGSTVMQHELEKQSGLDVKHKVEVNEMRIAKLRNNAKIYLDEGEPAPIQREGV